MLGVGGRFGVAGAVLGQAGSAGREQGGCDSPSKGDRTSRAELEEEGDEGRDVKAGRCG